MIRVHFFYTKLRLEGFEKSINTFMANVINFGGKILSITPTADWSTGTGEPAVVVLLTFELDPAITVEEIKKGAREVTTVPVVEQSKETTQEASVEVPVQNGPPPYVVFKSTNELAAAAAQGIVKL